MQKNALHLKKKKQQQRNNIYVSDTKQLHFSEDDFHNLPASVLLLLMARLAAQDLKKTTILNQIKEVPS
jgi:hypothetical protein